MTKVWLAAGAALFMGGTAAPAAADPIISTFLTHISAPMCQPGDSTAMDRLTLVNGAWTFRGTSTGTVTLWCPVPVNGELGGTAYTAGGYRIYYRDPDGSDTGAEITVRFNYRTTDGQHTHEDSAWSSNSVSSTEHRWAWRGITPSARLSIERFSYFVVTLRRNDADQSVAFTGISFIPPPVE